MRLSIDGVCTKLLTLTKGQQAPYGLRCAPSAKGGSFARRGLPASATSTHRPCPCQKQKPGGDHDSNIGDEPNQDRIQRVAHANPPTIVASCFTAQRRRGSSWSSERFVRSLPGRL